MVPNVLASLVAFGRRHPVWVLLVVLLVGIAIGNQNEDGDSRANTASAAGDSSHPPTPSPSPSPEVLEADPVVEVPSVAGQTLRPARRELERLGFIVLTREEFSRERPGTVLEQDPGTGSTLIEGSVIRLLVAKPLPIIPDVVGLRLSQARRALQAAGFRVEAERRVSNEARGSVISQTPVAGVEARPGRRITIVVAKPAPTSAGGEGTSCTAGYSPCLPPASDYDCIGGSGDGPEYTGTVTVTGSDPYGLDADNDGVGCE